MVLPRFLAELKHRNVYRAALVYAAVGWALLEAADFVLPRLGLPDWTVNFVLALVLLGFPIAMVFAWIFDFSAQGVARTEPLSPAGHPHRLNVPAVIEFVLICVLVVTVGYLYVERLSLQSRLVEPEIVVQETSEIPKPEQYRAVAVLPFADMSEAGDQAWFAEGIAEELLIALSQVDELNVMARTSSFSFKGTDKTIAEIADILGVQAVLEGSVRRYGDRVRITAQLVDARSGYHIWSGSYERQLEDIFQLQDELARAVVQALRIELGVDAVRPLVVGQTENIKAYNWFIRGRALWNWSDFLNVDLAISYFEKAVEADPDYAKAWGYLAYAQLQTFLWQPFEVASAAAIPAYEKALALDPGQSEALAAKALLIQIRDHDWETAGKLYQQAIGPGENLTAMGSYAIFYLQHIGHIEKAIQLVVEVEKRDPLHAGYKTDLSALYLWNGDTESGIRKAREALELNPQHQFALLALVDAYFATGNFTGLQQILEDIPLALQEHPAVRGRVALSYLSQGDYAKSREIYQELIGRELALLYQGLPITALLAVRLGELEKGIDLMETAVDLNMWNQFFIASRGRNIEAIKNHPRYLALLRRMRLDDESLAELHKRMSFD